MRSTLSKGLSSAGLALSATLVAAFGMGAAQPAAAAMVTPQIRVPPVHITPRTNNFALPSGAGVPGNLSSRGPSAGQKVVTRPVITGPTLGCGGGHYRYGSCVDANGIPLVSGGQQALQGQQAGGGNGTTNNGAGG